MYLLSIKPKTLCLKSFSMLMCVLFMLAGASSLHAADKTLQVRNKQKHLAIELKAKKKNYKVNESIDFTIRGNKTFFLYVYTINHDLNRAVLLIPGQKQKGNKYKGNTTFRLPNRHLEFYADSPGVEEIVAFASTVYFDFDTNGYVEKGGFFTTTAKNADKQVKALGLRSRQQKAEHAVEYLKLNIMGKPSNTGALGDISSMAPVARANNPVIVLNSNSNRYRINETVNLAYGADRDGLLCLYSCEPGGKVFLLRKVDVEKNQLYSLKLKAVDPAGEHAVVALFGNNNKKSFKETAIADIVKAKLSDKKQSKGLALVPEEKPLPAHAVVRFMISN